MKKQVKQITSLALCGALTLSLGIPAFAQEALEKSETIYTVLSPDGSVESQSVSVHLHRENGLKGAADESELANIQCTQGQGGFTQNGESITWNVEESEAYYKGDSDRTAPVSANITYSLNGQTAPLEQLLGKSGRLKISIDLTNHETSTTQVNGESRTVCTPFVTVVAAILDSSCKNLTAEHGKIESLSSNQVAGFVCLPGVRDSLEGLIPQKAAGLEDYLLDQVVVEADVENLSAPTVLIACATDPAELDQETLDLDELEDLPEDLDRLDDAMAELIDGAARLTDGTLQLGNGVGQLKVGAGQLDDGAVQLNQGVEALREGASALHAGTTSAKDGAGALKTGADQLSAGLGILKDGTGALAGGYQQLKAGSESLSVGLNTLNENSVSLTQGSKQALEGAAALVEAQGQLTTGSATFAGSLDTAATQGNAAVQQLLTPEAYGQLLTSLPAEQQTQLLAAYSGAYQAAAELTAGLNQLNQGYAPINSGIQQTGQASASLQQGLESLNQGITQYTQGVASAYNGASQLDTGLGQMGQQLPGLTSGVESLAVGASQLSAGAEQLQSGNTALANGAAQLSSGLEELSGGSVQLTQGIKALVAGTLELENGVNQVSDGAGQLEDGLRQFDEEGLSKLTEGMDPDQLKVLKDVTNMMREQLKDYGSFSGAAEGTEVTTKFIMKTTQPEASQNKPEAEKTSASAEEKESFWDRLISLFGF